MYQDLIRNELNEAAETLANFLQDEANIHAIQRAAAIALITLPELPEVEIPNSTSPSRPTAST